MSDRSSGLTTPASVIALFLSRSAEKPDAPAIAFKRNGEFVWRSWRELRDDVVSLAEGLRRSGAAPGDRVIQLSENRYEWIVADLAIQLARCIHVPIHASLAAAQVAEQVVHSGARIAVASSADQAAKLGIGETGNPLAISAVYDDAPSLAPGLVSIASLLSDPSEETSRRIERDFVDHVSLDDTATILYTSGTTGEPKGVMLSHGNLLSNAVATLRAFGSADEDLRLNFLPLSHIFARTCDVYTWIAGGSRLGLAESRESVLADCAVLRPTLLNGVPYFYDKLAAHLHAAGRADESGALREILGGAIQCCCSGGAALPGHVFDFYESQGIPLLEGYGLTETSPVITLNSVDACRRGAVGRPIPGVEVRIAEDGEVQTRGPHVMQGYYRNEESTRQSLTEDGWLHTGDIGRLDKDGFLYITGRKKEILVTLGGKNIAPVYLESLLTADPLIVQALVVGDGRKFLAALIVPDAAELRKVIIEKRIGVRSPAEALVHPEVLAIYDERIRDRLSAVSHYEQVQRFRLLDRGFTLEAGELTPKLSLRRKVIESHFESEIAALYDTPCQ